MSAPIVAWSPGTASLDGWSASAAEGSHARLSVEDGALRVDFALAGAGSWAIARRVLDAALPAHWVAIARLRGQAAPHELQVKLVGPGGANVWWWRRPGFDFPREGTPLVLRRAALEFAWGPASGGDPERIGAVEVAVAADREDAGTFWIEELRIEPRAQPAEPPQPAGVRASTGAPGHEPACALDADARTSWRPAPGDAEPWIELDLGAVREWGGLIVRFADAAPAGRVLASDDGVRWQTVLDDAGGRARRWLRTGDVESRFIRLVLPAGDGGGLVRVGIVPLELALSPARWAAARARAAPRGRFPRHLLGEQACWAVVGADGDERKGILSEDGALEVDAEAFTIEPFLRVDGRLLTWADVASSAVLADGCLPIPSVEWTAAGLGLRITAFATGPPGRSALVAHYRVNDAGDTPRTVELLLAIRPFQVMPAWQQLNLTPAIAPIERIARAGACIRVNEVRDVIAVTRPDRFAAAGSEAGPGAVLDGTRDAAAGEDPLGFAEGALAWEFRLAPGASAEVVVAVPLHAERPPLPAGLAPADAAAWARARLEEARAHWRTRLDVPISLPPSAGRVAETLRASLAWILVNREGPRIQPGPRCYRRSWIRDGALTGTALAEMGLADEARAFLRWYAPYQLADGRVPCAVDRRGVDRAVEHDSHGELVWAVVEVSRLANDDAFLRELWPRVLRAVDAIDRLRAERTGDAYRGTPAFGLLPESISHEGYASHPVHSYWDDFFALRALADAADAAAALGDAPTAHRIGALRDAMRRDVRASIVATMARHGIDFVPGSVELGDFDPTSTAIAFDPCGEAAGLPRPALERTYERWWREIEARRDAPPEAYSPYELRNVVALLQLGWKNRALALLDRILDDQRPPGWRQWPEIAWHDARAPRFLGDLPHGWVASTFVRAVRRLLVHERAEDHALVIGAGVPEAWVHEAPGIRIRGLPTRFGPLHLTLRAEDDHTVRATFGPGLRPPPGGIVLVSPLAVPIRNAVVDGRPHAAVTREAVHLRDVPADVVLHHSDG